MGPKKITGYIAGVYYKFIKYDKIVGVSENRDYYKIILETEEESRFRGNTDADWRLWANNFMCDYLIRRL